MRFSIYQSSVFLLFLGASFTVWLSRFTGATATEDDLVVHLNTGPVRGRTQKSIFGLTMEQFLGIPYAAAPVGDLRFSPPQPVQPWEDVRDGTNYGARCPQNEDSYPRNTTVGMFKAVWYLNFFPLIQGTGHMVINERAGRWWVCGHISSILNVGYNYKCVTRTKEVAACMMYITSRSCRWQRYFQGTKYLPNHRVIYRTEDRVQTES